MQRTIFWKQKFCKGTKPCEHLQIRQFTQGSQRENRHLRYRVCNCTDTCSLKSDTPVRAQAKEAL